MLIIGEDESSLPKRLKLLLGTDALASVELAEKFKPICQHLSEDESSLPKRVANTWHVASSEPML